MIGKHERFSGIERLTHLLTTVLLVQFTTFYLFVQQPQKWELMAVVSENRKTFHKLFGPGSF